MKKMFSGFSLIELVFFIVIFAIASIAILRSFQAILTVLPNANRQNVATELAQGRMDVILGQFLLKGFNNFSDPCPGAAVCQTLTGYTVNSAITQSGSTKTVTVTVSGLGSAILTMQVSG